jgi:hypothetical protein
MRAQPFSWVMICPASSSCKRTQGCGQGAGGRSGWWCLRCTLAASAGRQPAQAPHTWCTSNHCRPTDHVQSLELGEWAGHVQQLHMGRPRAVADHKGALARLLRVDDDCHPRQGVLHSFLNLGGPCLERSLRKWAQQRGVCVCGGGGGGQRALHGRTEHRCAAPSAARARQGPTLSQHRYSLSSCKPRCAG